MSSKTQLIELPALRELVALGAVRSAALVAAGSGFAIRVRCGLQERTLASQRGGVRVMAMETAARQLFDLGVGSAEVEMAAWRPKRRAA